MNFESFSSFINMGGHAPYIWFSYGLFLAILAINLTSPLLSERKFLQDQARKIRRGETQ